MSHPAGPLWRSESRLRRLFLVCLAVVLASLCLVTAAFVSRAGGGAQRRIELRQLSLKLAQTISDQQVTITLFRDTLDQVADLTKDEQRALAKSTLDHTRHLLGLALARAGQAPDWHAVSMEFLDQDQALIAASLPRKLSWRMRWSTRSTRLLWGAGDRPLLVIHHALASRRNRSSVTAVFDLQRLLRDFFAFTVPPSFAVQVVDGDRVLYRSPAWPSGETPSAKAGPSSRLSLGNLSWRIQAGSSAAGRSPRWLLLAGVVLALASSAAMLQAIDRLRRLATTDELTGISNRRGFLERWHAIHASATRAGEPLACLMIDVDGFKRVNDLLGHHTGDQLLQAVVRNLRVRLRPGDLLARLGGDEFVIALPRRSADEAGAMALALRELSVPGPWAAHPALGPVRISVGLGVADGADSAARMLELADADLYASRQALRAQAAQQEAGEPSLPG